MDHSIALITGTTSGLGYAAAGMLAGQGWRENIVTGRSLARVQETLHAKIGQLTLENDFLEGALTKAGLLSAKR